MLLAENIIHHTSLYEKLNDLNGQLLQLKNETRLSIEQLGDSTNKSEDDIHQLHNEFEKKSKEFESQLLEAFNNSREFARSIQTKVQLDFEGRITEVSERLKRERNQENLRAEEKWREEITLLQNNLSTATRESMDSMRANLTRDLTTERESLFLNFSREVEDKIKELGTSNRPFNYNFFSGTHFLTVLFPNPQDLNVTVKRT